jgi:hypothetical protein
LFFPISLVPVRGVVVSCCLGCVLLFIVCGVGKYLTDSEWQIFNRQRMLVIDGKYKNEDGMSTGSL